MQALEHDLLPGAARPHATAIEVQQVNRPVRAQQDVVRIEIGVLHAALVKASDADADVAPTRRIERRGLQVGRERRRPGELCGDQIRTIDHARPAVARGYGAWHRQRPRLQTSQQTPFPKCARAVLAGPEIPIAEDGGDSPAPPIVTQYPASLTVA